MFGQLKRVTFRVLSQDRKRDSGWEGGRMRPVPRNWLHRTMASRSRATSAGWGRYHTLKLRVRDFRQTQNLTYTMWGKREGGVSGIWACVCACVLGEGWSGVKVRKKRRQQQTKEKVKKRGWGLAGNHFFCLNLTIPLWKIYFYHKSLRINCVQLLEMVILLVEVRVFIAVTNSASQFCPFQWDLPSAAKHTQALLCSCGWRQPSLSNSLLV